MKIRALVIDDESLARARICKLLAGESNLEVIGQCGNGREAIASIQNLRPDLVFLDVQMPEVTGFDVLRALPVETWPVIIFITAYDQHAVEAFEIHALDYLLKPFTQARLLTAVERARKHLLARETSTLNQQLAAFLKPSESPAYMTRVAIKSGGQTVFVKVEDIDYIEAAANYAVLQTRGENHVLRETLTNLEAKLPPRLFLRISRSIIVNLDRVKGIKSAAGDEHVVVLHDGRQLLMTRGVRDLQEKLQYPASQLNASPA
jgi:two-component system LytT family response regulator